MKMELELFLSLSLSFSPPSRKGVESFSNGFVLFFETLGESLGRGVRFTCMHVCRVFPVSALESFLTELAAVTTVNGVRDIYSEPRPPSFRTAPVRFQGSQGNC